ncbi:MAG TPA: hypothetical protein VIF62_22030 [Labilithrix sp.]
MLARCTDLTPAIAAGAARSRDALAALLGRMALLVHPGEGAPQILFAVALVTAAEWVEGVVRVELADEHGATRLDVFAEHAGVCERLLPTITFPVSIDEFRSALTDAPELAAPLSTRELAERIVLTARRAANADTQPPPQFEIAEESMCFEHPTVKRTNPLTAEAFRSGQTKRYEFD